MKNKADLQEKTIILAGSGRSGTTWLGNIISANPNIGILFEPFDHRRVPEIEPLKLFTYARTGQEYPAIEQVVHDMLMGQITNEWVDQQKRRTHLFVRKNLVKTIRANLMLGWITKKFNPKVVYAMRHPCAVIHSRIKLNWTTSLDHFLHQEELVEDYLSDHVGWIQDSTDLVEQQAIVWCIENLVPLHQIAKHNWLLCTYEHMVRDPFNESTKVLKHLDISPTWFTRRALNRASMVSRPDSAINSGSDPLADWQKKLSADDVSKILNVLERFEIDIYSDQLMPNLDGLKMP
ncbi:MAG: sulfotransferase [Anaerolineae bacterium]